ncbi:MAG TPA: MFS transporter, partial [Pyrinomonadaceae bacterium]|nr:MFS transporter [Pyrinomonadaceae bacterium]
MANTELATSNPLLQVLRIAVDVKPNEIRALFLSFIYYFLILSSYYVIRPIRDEFGAASGVENLAWLFTGTLVVMLIANTAFAGLVARFTRRRFIPIAYRFLIANLLIFFLLLLFFPTRNIWIGRAFFVWTSVFNLFVLSVFWAFMVDVFNSEQGKRLFGFISVGGTLGAIVGAAITATLVQRIGTLTLLLISAVLVELSAQCVRFFPSVFKLSDEPAARQSRDEKPVGGGIWAGVVHNFSSPYLLGISAYILLYSITSTLLYFQQVGIAAGSFSDRLARTAFFAKVDLAVNILTILVQLFITGRLLKWLGVGMTLAIL